MANGSLVSELQRRAGLDRNPGETVPQLSVPKALRMAVGTVGVGLLGAGFAIAFRMALRWGLAALLHQPDVLTGFQALPAWERLVLPAVGGLLAGLVAMLTAQRVEGHGLTEVFVSLVLGRGELSLRTILWKALASFFAIVTGGSIGREGPIIQFGAGAGSTLGAGLGLPAPEVRSLVAAGTAAGFAAAYNTPLAAVLFVLEVFTGGLRLAVVAPVIAATVIATYLTRLAVGGGPLYGMRTFTLTSDTELLLYVVLGALAGVAGAVFLEALARAEVAMKQLLPPRWLRAAVGGAGVGAIAIWHPAVTGNGYEAIQLILDGKLVGVMLAVLLGFKALATVSSVSSGTPGGVFTPSLFLGAALGGLVGWAAPHLLALGPEAHREGGYALVGMAAMIASTTRAPIMAAMLVFELSGDYAVVLPLLLATSAASVVSSQLRSHSIYEEEVRKRGLVQQGPLTQRLAEQVLASDLMRPAEPGERPAVTVSPATPLLALSTIFEAQDLDAVGVGDEAHLDGLMGVVTRRALLEAFHREVLQREPGAARVA
jgi:CIC family chloride channel protein